MGAKTFLNLKSILNLKLLIKLFTTIQTQNHYPNIIP